MRWTWALPFILCALAPSARAQTVLMDVPLALQAPRYDGIMMAWYDGTRFWVDVAELTTLLGYEVYAADSLQVTARDARRSLAFDAVNGTVEVNREARLVDMESMLGPEGQMLVHLDALQIVFDPDLEWDEAGLTLRVSSAAILFDPTKFGRRKRLGSEPPARVLFPRERKLLGGVHLNYDLRHIWSRESGSAWSARVRTTAAMAGGVVRANLSRRNPSASYTLTMNQSWLTRLQISYRSGAQLPSVRVTNRPLTPIRIFGERTLRGQTLPHAIVRAKVGGTPTDQAQADRSGQYALRVPIFYGTTRSSIEVEPLGEDPMPPIYTYDLTPRSALQRGRLEYDAQMDPQSARSSAVVSYGVSNRLTVRGTGGLKPTRTVAGVTVRLLNALIMEADTDVLQGTGAVRFRSWRPGGSFEMEYNRYQADYQVLTGTGLLQYGRLSVSGGVSHRRFPTADPITEISPSIGWYSQSGIGASLRGKWIVEQPDILSASSQVSWSRSIRRNLIRISAGTEVGQRKIQKVQSALRFSSRRWLLAVQGERDIEQGRSQLRVSAQLETDWAWLGIDSRIDAEDVRLTQRARGTVGIDRGIIFSAIVQDNAQAVFRVFVDDNLNGKLDDTEQAMRAPRLDLHSHPLHRRTSGEFRAMNLSPNETYTVTLLAESITNPLLYPVTGYEFAFVAEAGRTRYIDIPLQLLPLVEGQVTGWTGAHELLSVVVSGMGIERTLDVYRDGAFFTQIPAGIYDISVLDRITLEVLAHEVHTLDHSSPQILIDLGAQ